MAEKSEFQSFDQLIDNIIVGLKDSEILMIKNADPAGIHFALDRWVKSEFLNDNVIELVSDKILEESLSKSENIHSDDISGFIIQEIIRKIHQ